LLAVLWTVLTASERRRMTWKPSAPSSARQGHGPRAAEIFGGFGKMPKTMVQLAAVQFFTWIALFAMWIYTTNAIGENVFGTTDAQSAAFQEAGNHVGVMFAVYGGVSALAAFILPVFARYTSRKVVHLTCLVIGGVSLFSIYAIHDLNRCSCR
jgi:maltose/moltooligosaccharide transporter